MKIAVFSLALQRSVTGKQLVGNFPAGCFFVIGIQTNRRSNTRSKAEASSLTRKIFPCPDAYANVIRACKAN
ncbi:hypothetical protein HMPREF9413_5463 [Paenibacillus sp. HGF7]|nr:hypothetical protein HMPREF9413_5463 [Paenibacillus sp. HGF7]